MSSFKSMMQNRGLNLSDFRTFQHEGITLPELTVETLETGRTYVTPYGAMYPSITTVLSINSKEGIARWRAKVGEAEANRISKKAAERGTRIHEMCEDYLNNHYAEGKPVPDVANDRDNFGKIKRILDKNVGKIYALEVPLYSDTIKIAGRTDLIADWSDIGPSIIDFKTSAKPKEERYIQNYFEQGSGYAEMWDERIGWPIDNVVIVIAVDNAPSQVFVKKRDDYLPKLLITREKYRKAYGI